MRTTARFEISYTQYLDKNGKAIAELPAFARDAAALVDLYRWMVLMRTYDQKAIALQRTGQLGTYASLLGQEAINAAAGAAMRPEDVLLTTYRENGAQIMRGVKLEEFLLFWSGDERGSDYAAARGDFPLCITIGAHVTHAAGVAYAMKLKREARVAVAMFGDGATSKGDFYEGINAAGVWRLPAVFLVSNNQWAISVPRGTQTAAETLAQKAVAAGIEGLQVDGNDVIAVRDVLERALEKARGGRGATLIEALTYRLSDHTTADDASRYRSADEVSEAWTKDPVVRLRNYLVSCQAWDKTREEALMKDCNKTVQTAVEAYQKIPPPPPEQMFDHLYATLPAALEKQRAQALSQELTPIKPPMTADERR